VALQEIESSLLPALDFQSNREIVMVQGRSSGADAKSPSSSEWGTFSIAKMYMTTNIAHLSTFLTVLPST
jgi:hypothetical protein